MKILFRDVSLNSAPDFLKEIKVFSHFNSSDIDQAQTSLRSVFSKTSTCTWFNIFYEVVLNVTGHNVQGPQM